MPEGVVQTIVQDVKDGNISIEEIQAGLADGDLAIVGLEAKANEALSILQQPQQ